jgi:hypothetical protein
MDAAHDFWQAEYARDLLAGLGYEWDVSSLPDDEAIVLAEQEGYEWDAAAHMWRPMEQGK